MGICFYLNSWFTYLDNGRITPPPTTTKTKKCRMQKMMKMQMILMMREPLSISLLFQIPMSSRYSDEEETSYKVRSSATKLLAAIIGTRPDMLSPAYRSVSPVLISTFGDRERPARLDDGSPS